MLKSITVTNPKGESLKMELANPDSSGLMVRSIDGLGPPKSNINSTELAVSDGATYNSARAQSRNIVLSLGLMPIPLVEDSRLLTYRYFPLKKEVTLEIETDHRRMVASGYVESNEPDIFSSDETAQISIICTDPYLYQITPSKYAFLGIEDGFEFPFSNESLTDNLIIFSEIRSTTRSVLDYVGDVDAGIEITVHSLSNDMPDELRIYNVDTQEIMVLDIAKIKTITGLAYSAGEDIVISTKKSRKYVRLLRNGKYTNVIGIFQRGSSWFQISSGNNVFEFQADGRETELILTFDYRNAYWGI